MSDEVDNLHKIPLTQTPAPAKPPPVSKEPEPKPTMTNSNKPSPVLSIILAVVIVAAGIGTGYALSQLKGPTQSGGTADKTAVPDDPSAIKVGVVYGDSNDQKFPDAVEGIIVKGGIEGEGSHHLIRPGGKSQYVYLTSSVLDLDNFAGSKVAIRGETFSAQKAGWLMDVGQVKVLELNVASPEEAQPTEALPVE
jgi:hypothetical protein